MENWREVGLWAESIFMFVRKRWGGPMEPVTVEENPQTGNVARNISMESRLSWSPCMQPICLFFPSVPCVSAHGVNYLMNSSIS